MTFKNPMVVLYASIGGLNCGQQLAASKSEKEKCNMSFGFSLGYRPTDLPYHFQRFVCVNRKASWKSIAVIQSKDGVIIDEHC